MEPLMPIARLAQEVSPALAGAMEGQLTRLALSKLQRYWEGLRVVSPAMERQAFEHAATALGPQSVVGAARAEAARAEAARAPALVTARAPEREAVKAAAPLVSIAPEPIRVASTSSTTTRRTAAARISKT
jgi:hypothetical protein